MHENGNNSYSYTCSALTNAIIDAEARIRVSEQNAKLRDTYTDKLQLAETNVSLCNEVLEEMKPLLVDIQTYIQARRRESMQNINNALRLSGEIIQDSTDGIHFKMEKDEAWLATPDDLEVDMIEGGGYRQVSSTFIRSVVLAANSDRLRTLMLDEIFSLVSPENSAALSLYLNVMCQDMQVISIEQKPQVYSNIDNIQYRFDKDNEFAEVTKTVVKRGEI